MGRPPKDPAVPGPYAAKAKGWLCCDTCKVAIPYSGNSDPEHGMGWPQHRCAKTGKPAPFDRYSDTNPHPPVILTPWDEWADKPKSKISPEIIIG